MEMTLAGALRREHVDIDAGIEAFRAGLPAGSPPVDAMGRALAAHRRHIYLEEALLFPPLRKTRLFAAIVVMLREHGQMWRLLDELEPLVLAGGTDPRVPGLCTSLVALLEAHNAKEEGTIYAQAEPLLNAPASAELREFLLSGAMPAGWRCAMAGP